MPRRPALFTETDVQRAIKAALAAGLTIGGFEIDREGTIRVLLGTEPIKPIDQRKKVVI